MTSQLLRNINLQYENIKTVACDVVNQVHWPPTSDQLGAAGTRQWTWWFCERRCL